ncbi:penicillin-binding protein 1A [Succinatimonas hippei]|uniref:penicillin-binding protein 1A n=1 Tax=Succinatimonas hippei TaxID=626938 RepID=UPI0024916F3F|nr:penicillin-binding protein 1A [Succinatimonas hippei]
MILRIIRGFFWSSLLCIALAGGAVAGIYYNTLGEMPDVEELKNVTFETPMQIFSSDGLLIGEFGENKRIPVDIKDIPVKMQQAFLAIEDSRFYEHSGIDPIGIIRAAVVSISNASATQGASTITQQVARNFFLTREKTIKRKLKEIFISWRIEQVLTKDEILELYLNKIALGHRSYGVAAAAYVYYGKELKDLTLGEIATIAGLPKAPSTLNPITSPTRAKERRHLVLGRMLDLGYITKEEYEAADNEPSGAVFHGAPIELNAQYVAEEARQFALEKFGEEAYTAGLRVYTTVNSKDQIAAQYAVFKGLSDYDQRHGYRKALINVRNIEDFEITEDNLKKLLAQNDVYNYIHPGIVTKIDDKNQNVQIMRKNGFAETIPWEGMKWARPFINDRRQGNAPRKPADFLCAGDLIYTYVTDDGKLRLSQVPEAEAALIALRPGDGAIAAMVGGYDFNKSKFNRVIQSSRQTGSNFKPFIYSAAVAKGIAVNSTLVDEPLRMWETGSRTWWEPKNTPNRYDGVMTLREGLARSKNIISIKLINKVGIDAAVEHVKKFGIEVPKSQQVTSMALGVVEVSPLQLVSAYSVFANGGYKVTPYLVSRIEKDGQVIYEADPKIADPSFPDKVINDISLKYNDDIDVPENSAEQVLSHGHAFIVSDLLRSVIYGGAGIDHNFGGTGNRAARYTGRTDLHGKTGTTNDIHDAWFSGFNANLVATAWVGFDDSRNLGHSYAGPEGGAYTALPIFTEFFKRAQDKNVPPALIDKPKEVTMQTYNGVKDYVLPGTFVVSQQPTGQAVENTGVNTSNISEDSIF